MTLPDETLGEALDRIRDEVADLPWYLWPIKTRLTSQLRQVRRDVVTRRNEGLRRYFAS